MPKVDIPSWLSALIAMIALIGAIAGAWWDNREEVTELSARVAQQQHEIANLKAADDKTARALRDVEKVLVKVDTTIDFLRGRLGLGAPRKP